MVGGVVAATAEKELGGAGVVVAPVLWEVGATLASMGLEEVFFVCLEAGGSALGVWEPAKKFRRLPSCLEGQASDLGPWWKGGSDQ